jgi:two-component system, chemotaxis family, sensor kinase Cph1
MRRVRAILNLARASLWLRVPRRVEGERLLEELRREFPEVELSIGSMPEVRADRRQLTQVFRTLIGNAARHRGAEPARVRVSARPVGRQWHFEVSDNGVGIEPARHREVFDPLRGATELPAVRRFVRRHGGRMWVESARGQGATFHFSLPATREITHA